VPVLRSSARDNRETSAVMTDAQTAFQIANSCAAPATVVERGRATSTLPLGDLSGKAARQISKARRPALNHRVRQCRGEAAFRRRFWSAECVLRGVSLCE
jgi:hypothetical protein